MPDQVLLRVTNLKKYFPVKSGLLQRVHGYVKAVDDVSFDIYKGETLGLVGESGCGKTTAARAVLQLQRPTSGAVLLNDKDLTQTPDQELRPLRTQMQIIFQNPYTSLNPRMTVGAAIAEPMQAHGIAKGREASERVGELLEMVGLNRYFAGRFPSEFSGGQRQRIGIARALSVNPSFVICDEPISSLDISIQAQIVNLLKQLQQELGLTYLFISHDLRMVRHISNRVAVMYLGKIVELGTNKVISKNPMHPYLQALWSALPMPDPEREKARERIVLRGDVPSPINPPQGCRFCTRCPNVMEICREIEPPLRELEPEHLVACHLYD